MRASVFFVVPVVGLSLLLGTSCEEQPVELPELDVHSQAHGCWTIAGEGGALTRSGEAFALAGSGTALRFHPADLGTVLLYDPDGGYVVGEGGALARQTVLESDATRYEEGYVSGAEWALETSATTPERYQLRNRASGQWMAADGLTGDVESAAAVQFVAADGCADHPELALNAEGSPARTTWDDGDLFGFVDMHSHMFTNHGFGGGLFHGAPFHPLGVEHALGDCTEAHGEEGRRDFFGYVYDTGGSAGAFGEMLPDMLAGELSQPNHATDGYPTFTEWPNVRTRSTHQVQYYKWMERSWLAGMRLVVQLATSNAVVCNLSVGEGWSPSRYDCEDMTAVDREIDAAYELERYVDAQSGGPGRGWFRLVGSPAEARSVIAEGKMAVVLGIETSDLFNCHLTRRPGGPTCDEAYVDAQLDAYGARGVRVLFPNHKYDNAFAPGDGQDGFIEAGNFMNSGHYTNKVEEGCPTDVPPGFDHGSVTFGGLLEPRDEYMSPAPVDMTDFPLEPLTTMLPYAATLLGDPVEGDFCQNGTLTPVGEHLVDEVMKRGMILDLDHLARRAYVRTFEKLEAADYPALGTHGRDNNGRLFALGGMSQGSFGRCHDPENPGASLNGYRSRLERMVEAGMHRSLGFAFDLNGFAGGPSGRFAPGACGGSAQEDPVTYPFTSYDGGVTFTEPWAGERLYDFNAEGMVHVGLIPEYIEDARRDGVTDEELEPLFRSAEGFVRMWEKAEARAAALRGE